MHDRHYYRKYNAVAYATPSTHPYPSCVLDRCSFREDEHLNELKDTIGAMGGRVEHVSGLRDAVLVSFEKSGARRLLLGEQQPAEASLSDLPRGDSERGDQSQREMLSRSLSKGIPNHLQDRLHYIEFLVPKMETLQSKDSQMKSEVVSEVPDGEQQQSQQSSDSNNAVRRSAPKSDESLLPDPYSDLRSESAGLKDITLPRKADSMSDSDLAGRTLLSAAGSSSETQPSHGKGRRRISKGAKARPPPAWIPLPYQPIMVNVTGPYPGSSLGYGNTMIGDLAGWVHDATNTGVAVPR